MAATRVVTNPGDLGRAVLASDVQAVFLEDGQNAPWLDTVTDAVERGDLRLPRSELTGVEIDAMASWLDRHLPRDVRQDARDSLLSDILRLAHTVEDLTAARWYKLRIFTQPPDRRCGFHVDTVPPGAPVWGAFRVYNGRGTDWVDPSQVRSMGAFYDWLRRRDDVVRRYVHRVSARDAELEALDARPDFLVERALVRHVPAGTTVIFKHLDASRHWSDHAVDAAWIHCSPMRGLPRLVVNVSPHRRAQ